MIEKQSPNTLPVLLVEDSIDDVEAVRRAFSKADMVNPLEHASSAEDALKYLKKEGGPRPCLILLDLNMPGIGGRKLLELIKVNEALKEIPVLILTTSAYIVDIKDCYALGANTYIQKPVNFDLLCRWARAIKEYWIEMALLPQQLPPFLQR